MFQARPAFSTDVPRPLPICRFFAPHTRPTHRHSHTRFYVEPTGSSVACYKVCRRYAGNEILRLERRSPQPEHGSLRFKRHSTGDEIPYFERWAPQLRLY